MVTLTIESLGPRYKDPIAIAFKSNGCVHSRNTKVARCSTGNVGMNRQKNICKHSSRNTELSEVASTAAVIDEDFPIISYNALLITLQRRHTNEVTMLLTL